MTTFYATSKMAYPNTASAPGPLATPAPGAEPTAGAAL